MRIFTTLVVCALAGFVPQAFAQKWEFGGGVGTGFYTSQDLTSPAGTAHAKIGSNLAASVWVANNKRHWGGELRYDYQRGDLKLSGNSTEASFAAESHAVHYDFLYHGGVQDESSIRPFVAVGAGIKTYRGTGAEQLAQPLSRVALLTKAQDLNALLSLGAGIKVKLSEGVRLRLEVHDYLTAFPKEVIVPVSGKAGHLFQDIVPMVGFSFGR